MLVNRDTIVLGRTTDATGRAAIPQRNIHIERRFQMSRSAAKENRKPSHAPRLHVRISAIAMQAKAQKEFFRRTPIPAIHMEQAIGIIMIRYSPNMFGFSSVDVALPSMPSNRFASIHADVIVLPRTYCIIP